MRSTFKVLFYLKRNNPKPDGTAPVIGRITIDETISQFSCKMTVPPNLWDTKAGRMTGKNTLAVKTNLALDKIRVDINRHYQPEFWISPLYKKNIIIKHNNAGQ